MRSKPTPPEPGFEPGSYLESGVVDGGEKRYIFPEVHVIDVVSKLFSYIIYHIACLNTENIVVHDTWFNNR